MPQVGKSVAALQPPQGKMIIDGSQVPGKNILTASGNPKKELVCDILSDILKISVTDNNSPAATATNNNNHNNGASVHHRKHIGCSESTAEEEDLSLPEDDLEDEDEDDENELDDGDRLTFPQIWVQSFCQSSGEEEEDPMKQISNNTNDARLKRKKVPHHSNILKSRTFSTPSHHPAAELKSSSHSSNSSNQVSRKKGPQDKVIRSLLQSSSSSSSSYSASSSFCSSEDVSFESLPAAAAAAALSADVADASPNQSNRSSLDEVEEETKPRGADSAGREEEEDSCRLGANKATNGRSTERKISDESGQVIKDDTGGGSTIEEEECSPFYAPVASEIGEWLKKIQSTGFDSGLLRSLTKDDYDPDVEDDIWFQPGVVRVFDPYYDISPEDIKEVEGKTNARTGEPMGKCTIKMKNGDEVYGHFREGLRQGRGSIDGPNLQDHGLLLVKGFYKDSVLLGEGRAILAPGSIWGYKEKIVLEGVFNEGYLEGPVRGMGENGNVVFIGEFSKGLPTGPCWLAVEGQGWLHGIVDPLGKFTGDEILFLYPDQSSCLSGRFQDGTLVDAHPAQIQSVAFTSGHIMQLIPQPTENPSRRSSHSYCPSNSHTIACDWRLPDAYEQVTVKCQESSVDMAGDGLFARKDLPANVVVAYYNGLRILPDEHYGLSANCNYQIYVDWLNTNNSPYIDIPNSCIEKSAYCASLAHKANHSFNPNCQYVPVEHPRFGRIPGLKTIKAVRKGEELFSHYKYDMVLAPNWYVEAWEYFSTGTHDDGLSFQKLD